ncbi:MAG TPA: hypothetical protein VFJ08_14080, partial [Salinisphaera sp.]|nr:hypothetical protein [Salinisphaera sp.]
MPDTKALARGIRVQRFANIAKVARRKLRQLEIAGRLEDLSAPPDNRLEALKAAAPASTAFASTTNGGCAFVGVKRAPKRSRSWIITRACCRFIRPRVATPNR